MKNLKSRAVPAELISIGNVCLDLFIPHHRPPPRGGITYLPSLAAVPGGNSSNTAIAAARLGVRTAVTGVLGDDLFGRHLRDFLQAEGVDISLLRLLPARQSPVSLVLNDESGERSFVHAPGTDADFRLPEEAFAAKARHVHFAAPELLGSFWPDGAIEAARRFRSAGATLSLDTFVDDSPGAAEAHRPLLELVDLALPNEEEARRITGRSDAAGAARALVEMGVRLAVVKRGELGALAASRDERHEAAAERVRVVDTCGAGDNFAGGFLAAWLRGLPLARCLEVGCAMGTRCVTAAGSLTAGADPTFLRSMRERLG